MDANRTASPSSPSEMNCSKSSFRCCFVVSRECSSSSNTARLSYGSWTNETSATLSPGEPRKWSTKLTKCGPVNNVLESSTRWSSSTNVWKEPEWSTLEMWWTRSKRGRLKNSPSTWMNKKWKCPFCPWPRMSPLRVFAKSEKLWRMGGYELSDGFDNCLFISFRVRESKMKCWFHFHVVRERTYQIVLSKEICQCSFCWNNGCDRKSQYSWETCYWWKWRRLREKVQVFYTNIVSKEVFRRQDMIVPVRQFSKLFIIMLFSKGRSLEQLSPLLVVGHSASLCFRKLLFTLASDVKLYAFVICHFFIGLFFVSTSEWALGQLSSFIEEWNDPQ